jgi:dolichol-phosphate mannosyltransferase
MTRTTDWCDDVALSVVIPAFNEAEVIRPVVDEAVRSLAEIIPTFEVIVVDDGSSDGTGGSVPRSKCVRLVTHTQNRGYADALRSGFAAARFGLVAFTDADGQFDLADLRRLIPAAMRNGLAVGYRMHRQDPWLRKVYSRGYNLLARALCGTRARDCDCALKVFRRDVLHVIWPRSKGYFINTEMLTRARQLGYPLVEFPVTHRPRRGGVSKVSVREIPRVFRTLITFWWRHVVFGAKPVPAPSTVYATRVRVPEPSTVARAA